AYVPLDPAYPAARLRYMLEDSAPVALLTETSLLDLVPGMFAGPVLDLTAAVPPWQEQPTTNPSRAAVGLEPTHLAYVIYTSGSTGTPKGVMVEHRGVVNRLDWMQRAYRLTKDDAILQKTP